MTLQQINSELPEDVLNRFSFARRIADLIHDAKPIVNEKSVVIALNSPWGTGKSYLVKLLSEELLNSEEYMTYIYNAWEHDDYPDALIPIIGDFDEIHSLNTEHKEQIKNKIKDIITTSLSTIASGWVQTKCGFSISEFISNIRNNKSTITNNIYEDYKESKKKKEILSEIISLVLNTEECVSADEVNNTEEGKRKLVIFVDDLDRCRPTFAIETLEVIKHFFDLENVIFVFSLDYQQLEEAIRLIYGNIDSTAYLRKFFDYEYAFPVPSYLDYISSRIIQYTKKDILIRDMKSHTLISVQLEFTPDYLELLNDESTLSSHPYQKQEYFWNWKSKTIVQTNPYFEYIDALKAKSAEGRNIVRDFIDGKNVSYFSILKVLPPKYTEEGTYLSKIATKCSISLRDLDVICRKHIDFMNSISHQHHHKNVLSHDVMPDIFKMFYWSLFCIKYRLPSVYSQLIYHGVKVGTDKDSNISPAICVDDIKSYFPHVDIQCENSTYNSINTTEQAKTESYLLHPLLETVANKNLRNLVYSTNPSDKLALEISCLKSDYKFIVNENDNTWISCSGVELDKDEYKKLMDTPLIQLIYNYIEYHSMYTSVKDLKNNSSKQKKIQSFM